MNINVVRWWKRDRKRMLDGLGSCLSPGHDDVLISNVITAGEAELLVSASLVGARLILRV